MQGSCVLAEAAAASFKHSIGEAADWRQRSIEVVPVAESSPAAVAPGL